jgi:hypothetical protein
MMVGHQELWSRALAGDDDDVPGLDQFLAGICALTGVLFPPFEATI